MPTETLHTQDRQSRPDEDIQADLHAVLEQLHGALWPFSGDAKRAANSPYLPDPGGRPSWAFLRQLEASEPVLRESVGWLLSLIRTADSKFGDAPIDPASEAYWHEFRTLAIRALSVALAGVTASLHDVGDAPFGQRDPQLVEALECLDEVARDVEEDATGLEPVTGEES